MRERLKEAITHPLTAGAVVLSAIAQLGFGFIDPLWGLIASTSSLWFPAVATTASTILPELGYEAISTPILVASAVLFVAVQLDRLVDRVQQWISKR